jgi:DNA-binding NtrC family response regulator
MTDGTIILVEDDCEQQQLYSLVLAAHYQLDVVADSKSALSLLEQRPVDLVLTDWQLPGMNGDLLIAEIHRHYPWLKTILMSTDAQVCEAAQEVGADGWYRKGSGITRLRTLVAELLTESSAATTP